jgi:lipopolysaccharide/colanic/teichoic acid biosynthesis glycosyltransferase
MRVEVRIMEAGAPDRKDRQNGLAKPDRPEARHAPAAANGHEEEPWWRRPGIEFDVSAVPVHRRTLYDVCKRCIDVVGALVLLVLLFPLFVVIAIAIKATSPGPVLFKQKRIGRRGVEFMNYKFRTMVADAEKLLMQDPELRAQFVETFKIKGDPRVTRLGAFLRKTSLDETPQVINVLRGDISLIGPRALQWAELGRYGDGVLQVLSIRPGLSGLWQARGRSDTSYQTRVRMDLEYVEKRCLLLDLRLIAGTVIAVFRCDGAC